MADDLGVFVVQRQTDQVWEANCVNLRCGQGMHNVAESIRPGDAKSAATRHRNEIRAELAEAEQRAASGPVADWQALAEDRERRLSSMTGRLFALRRYIQHIAGCASGIGRVCDCGLADALGPFKTITDKETPNG